MYWNKIFISNLDMFGINYCEFDKQKKKYIFFLFHNRNSGCRRKSRLSVFDIITAAQYVNCNWNIARIKNYLRIWFVSRNVQFIYLKSKSRRNAYTNPIWHDEHVSSVDDLICSVGSFKLIPIGLYKIDSYYYIIV